MAEQSGGASAKLPVSVGDDSPPELTLSRGNALTPRPDTSAHPSPSFELEQWRRRSQAFVVGHILQRPIGFTFQPAGKCMSKLPTACGWEPALVESASRLERYASIVAGRCARAAFYPVASKSRTIDCWLTLWTAQCSAAAEVAGALADTITTSPIPAIRPRTLRE